MTINKEEVRKANLLKLKATWGDEWVRLAKKLGYANATGLHQLMSGNRPFSEKIARRIEQKLHLEPEWLDGEHTSSPEEKSADGLLEKVIAALESARKIENVNAESLAKKYGRLVAFAYEDGMERGLQGERWYRNLLRLILQE